MGSWIGQVVMSEHSERLDGAYLTIETHLCGFLVLACYVKRSAPNLHFLNSVHHGFVFFSPLVVVVPVSLLTSRKSFT